MGKRANGEGSVYRRADGKWVAAVTDPVTGRKVRAYRTTQAAAREALDALRDRIRAGRPARDSNATFEQAANGWVNGPLRLKSVSQSTKDTYVQALNAWVNPHLGRMRLSTITRRDIEAMLLGLADTGRSGSTMNTALTVTRHVLRDCVANHLIARDPSEGIGKPKTDRVRPFALATPEITLAVMDAASPSLRVMIALLATTGMRAGEALALDWADIDLDARTITVQATAYRQRGKGRGYKIERAAPKTAMSRRSFPMSESLALELRRWRDSHETPRIAGPVIHGDHGQRRDYSNLAAELRSIRDDVNAGPVTFHSWRHGAAVLMMEAGTPDRVAADMLGHANVSTTRRVYQHTREASAVSAMNVLGAALRGPTSGPTTLDGAGHG